MKLGPLKLRPVVQPYAWGKYGQDSLIHRLLKSPEEKSPAAELWIGAHPSGASRLEWNGSERRLDELIAEHPDELLGTAVVSQFGPALPFLLKVLSVRTALSIQAHPDRMLAADLHRRDPANYPDKNHKPEMGIALSRVELLYGFRPLSDVRRELAARPALSRALTAELSKRLLQNTDYEGDQELLKDLYSYFLHLQDEFLVKAVADIRGELEEKNGGAAEDRWFLKLCEEHHSDVGLFSLFMLNHVVLEPGEGIFVGPNTPHAYLAGDLFECMASSDNVIRAGLTKKHRDVDALIGALHFKPAYPELISARSTGAAPGLFRYPAPAREFEVELLDTTGQDAAITLDRRSLGLVFCLEGTAELSSDAPPVFLQSGESAIIPAACSEVRVHGSKGKTFLVHVP